MPDLTGLTGCLVQKAPGRGLPEGKDRARKDLRYFRHGTVGAVSPGNPDPLGSGFSIDSFFPP